ncbi:hypothetical protein ACFWBI_12005 [Streptomyces sp. NPDC059982]|uniref:hypothetical protein n=1 Tax=unclassified Streptomyces TaxID=2593676 RepID=UPI0036AC572E
MITHVIGVHVTSMGEQKMSTFGMRRTTLAAAGLAVASTLVLTGCKDGNEDVAPAAPSASAPASQPGTPASPSASASGGYGGAPSSPAAPAPGGAAGAAKPGQQYKIGEAAEFPFASGSTKGQIALSVTKIEQGQAADLDVLKLGDKAKGKVPYYIHYTVKNTGTTDLSFTSVSHIKGLLGDGSEAEDLYIIGKFDKCKDDSLPKGFTNGQTQSSCAVALAPSADTKVAGAKYWGDPFTLKEGLTWK